ncbi:hypothetical protein TKK_0013182 [Trichogramma kaykai]|uniref:Discoidin domain-containing receptor 2 n=1 Tax=Trichogramma kaykai TaxID=54128 RepID=A0ABD2WJC0_9HYME
MESGAIADSALNASSSYVANVGPRYARLRKETAGGGWCPKRQIEASVREWIQVDLGDWHLVTHVETQGRFDHGRGQEYSEEFTVEYWRPGFAAWRPYKLADGREVFAGNVDTSTVVTRELVPAVLATRMRVLPHSQHRRTVCMRIELKGCRYRGGVVSYTIPDSPVEELSDTWYDGARESGVLSGGLGRLVDGEYGLDNYRLEMAPGRGTGWLAWMRDSFSDDYVELDFYFDDLLTFDAVHLYTNNYFKRDVQVFARADIWFIDAGPAGAAETTDESSTSSTAASASTTTTRIVDVELPSEPDVSYTYIPDTNLENARNVSIALHGKRGRSCRFRLYFAARWIMISEVTFDSWSPRAREVTTEEAAAATTLESASASTGVAEDRAQLGQDADLNLQTITAREEDQEYVEVLIGVLTAITLLLLLVFLVILWLSKRQKLQTSPTVFKNPFGFAISMKDFLLNLGLGRLLAAATAGRSHNNDHHQREEVVVGDDDEDDYDVDDAEDDNEKYDDEIETANIVNVGADRRLEDELSQESLTVEQQLNSPLVDGSSQYNRSTYAIVATSDGPAAFHELQQQQQQRNGPNKNELRSSKSFERGGLYGACNNYNNNNNNNGSNGSSSRSESGGANYASTSCNNTVAGSSRSCSPAHSVSHYSSSTSAKQQQQQQQQQYYRTLGHQHQHGQRHHGQTRFYGGVGGSTAALAQPIYQQQQQQHHAHHQMSSSDLECSSSSPTPMKRWHASAKVPPPSAAAAPPVVRWNIGPCQDQLFYAGKEVEPAVIPAQCLRTMEKLGSGPIGEVIVCEILGLDELLPYKLSSSSSSSSAESQQQQQQQHQQTMNCPRLCTARIPINGSNDPAETSQQLTTSCSTLTTIGGGDDHRRQSSSDNDYNVGEAMREIRLLAGLRDSNLARVLGVVFVSSQDQQQHRVPWTILEYTELGDLAHYLQYSEPLIVGAAQRPNCSLNLISQNCLLYMAAQIASAMRYLESKQLAHRDLAARNCLLGRHYQVKVTDIASCSDLYKRDYYSCDVAAGGEAKPIRWLAWESIVLDRYTCSSTAWSFAVTLWEITSLAREKPYQHLSDQRVLQNAETMYFGSEQQVLLPKPMMCPDNVYRIMRSCWRRDESRRPSFKKIYAFLKGVAADYRP